MGISLSIQKAVSHQLGLQSLEGYWWYTLEANESICAETIFLMRFLGEVDKEIEAGLARCILSTQRPDGTWSLYYGGPPDLSTTIECYWSLKLVSCHNDSLTRARDFILASGGITHSRVFTKIHLAQFGLIPWSACPSMPVELMLMPNWAPVNIYEFSSWARACIIPLLVVLQKKPVRTLGKFNLDELFAEPASERGWNYKTDKFFLSWERFFIEMNKLLKISERIPFSPFDGAALKKCEEWICEHIAKTEDIFPALAYGAIALSALGHPNSHPIIGKALNALKSFRQVYDGDDLPASLTSANSNTQTLKPSNTSSIHQQCCISPVWDTPWQLTALLEAGIPPDQPQLLKAGRWLIGKQITGTYGDWRIKNPDAKPGGWSFEFENEYFPDVDDTIQVLHVLNRLALPYSEKAGPIQLGLDWLLSMQNGDGGWGAFDKNNNLSIVNKIPFSDHGACLDPSSPDITGRMLGLLAGVIASVSEAIPQIQLHSGDCHAALRLAMTKAINYLQSTQEPFGGWFGRWGVNYIYGTWCVLAGLAGLPVGQLAGSQGWQKRIQRAADWLISIQHDDGGWSESPETYKTGKYEPYPPHPYPLPQGERGFSKGVPSQTAWAIMGLVAAQRNKLDSSAAADGNDIQLIDNSISRGIEFLLKAQREDGTWDEREFTGTGFPGHFYIRYHGYRDFFPLMALGCGTNDRRPLQT